MTISNSVRFTLHTTGIAAIVSLVNLIILSPSNAFTVNFDNPGFESDSINDTDFTGWDTNGDRSIQGDYQGLQLDGNQAGLTTACPTTSYPGGECFDTQDPSQPRIDDASGNFNLSGLDQVDANNNNTGSATVTNLQDFLGLSANTLNIDRTNSLISGTRTPKEGSAIQQEFTVSDGEFQLSFDWNFLTNDQSDSFFGDTDYAFITLYSLDLNGDPLTYYTSNGGSSQIDVLADTGSSLNSSVTNFTNDTGYQTYTSGNLPAGTYRVGLGVVDVDGTGYSSGLLVDRFSVQEVPFEFSPSIGLGLMAGLLGFSRLRRGIKQKNDFERM